MSFENHILYEDRERLVIEQPAPTANNSTPVWDLVIADMRERDRMGRYRYGTPLQVNNGRDALLDAYQEALDLVVYLRQAIEERSGGGWWWGSGWKRRECGRFVK